MSYVPRCPTPKRHEDDIVGCGSTNIEGPDFEGLYDCLDCGIWFCEPVPLEQLAGAAE